MAQPYLPFYASDWRGDVALRSCSLAARGLWIEMMAIMHEAKPYGHLIIGRKPVTLDDVAPLALQVAAPIADVRRAIIELRDADVFTVNEDGVIISRRMIRDEKRREADRNRKAEEAAKKAAEAAEKARNSAGIPDGKPPESGGKSSTDSEILPRAGGRDQAKPSLDQAEALAPLATGRARRSEAAMFGTWLFGLGLESGVIPQHQVIDPGPMGFAQIHLAASETLIATYGPDECRRRAQNMLARKARTDGDKLLLPATPATLRDKWDWFDTPERVRPGDHDAAPETEIQRRGRTGFDARVRELEGR